MRKKLKIKGAIAANRNTQFLAFVRKEFRHMFRDRKTLLILFGLPVVQILLFGFALTNEIKDSRIVICDYAKDEASRRIIERFAANNHFVVEESLKSHLQIEDAFQEGRIKLAVIFPANFLSDLHHLHQAQVQLIADASDPNTANILKGYATNILMDYQKELSVDSPLPYQIGSEMCMLYNPQLKGAVNFVPGVMSLILMLICVMMTSVSIVREKEYGTMEVLLVSPVNPLLLILSKAVPYLFLSLVNLTVIVVLSVTLLEVPVNGSLILLFLESTLFIITALSLGLLISNLVKTQQAAILFSLIGLMVPTILFTGFMFPIENMPVVLQWFANVIPSRWYYVIIKSVMIKGAGIQAVWKETVVLLLMTGFLLFISFRNFKTRLEA
ncbi:MAG TPA: multidrug ABC transporter permease [Porphyromonadaceae bacterium]|jgi:ABC-2 type transport system permease protein|nr:multidrug ABC transporter permease [Porphyromonadaceae bacterium]HBX20085.1 multidrug ABC transporter permease [Porphyromonadaceae bacterium]HCM19562.1 multidrug ABC transporter permease [Porphyromonadaceae bacterium]